MEQSISRVTVKSQLKEKNFIAAVRTADSGADEAVLEMTEDAFYKNVIRLLSKAVMVTEALLLPSRKMAP